MSDRVDLSDDEWRARLTPEQYAVLRRQATERAWTGPHLDEKRTGMFTCAGCGAELFRSGAKFESGSGWPSFFEAVAPGAVAVRLDLSHGMRREEVVCARCDGHLGHLFPDGPHPTGMRYCINGCALAFQPDGAGAGDDT